MSTKYLFKTKNNAPDGERCHLYQKYDEKELIIDQIPLSIRMKPLHVVAVRFLMF